MKMFIDFEFIDDSRELTPLSLGIASEDGRTYYAEWAWSAREIDAMADPWVKENVVPHLGHNSEAIKNRADIAAEVVEFVGENPEFWGYFCAYDWVLLCQMYGKMIQLPKGWPMYCRDLKQLMKDREIDRAQLSDPVTGHHALSDAMWARSIYFEINNIYNAGKPRRFVLDRAEDETGISGTGVVAWGVLFPDGKVHTRWNAPSPGVAQSCIWDSLDDLRTIHGHNGKTKIVWIDF